MTVLLDSKEERVEEEELSYETLIKVSKLNNISVHTI